MRKWYLYILCSIMELAKHPHPLMHMGSEFHYWSLLEIESIFVTQFYSSATTKYRDSKQI